MRALTSSLLAGLFLFSIGIGHAHAQQTTKKKKSVSCGDVAASMEESNGSLSAEEIASKLHTSVKRVRQCWDQQEAQQKKGAAASQPKTGGGTATGTGN